MAERAADPVVLGRIPDNGAILARLAADAARSPDGIGTWSPDGYVLRTHPDLTEALERAAGRDTLIVYGIAVVVLDSGLVHAVGWGTGRVWLRADASFGEPVPGMPGWVAIDAWRTDLEAAVRSSAGTAAAPAPEDPGA